MPSTIRERQTSHTADHRFSSLSYKEYRIAEEPMSCINNVSAIIDFVNKSVHQPIVCGDATNEVNKSINNSSINNKLTTSHASPNNSPNNEDKNFKSQVFKITKVKTGVVSFKPSKYMAINNEEQISQPNNAILNNNNVINSLPYPETPIDYSASKKLTFFSYEPNKKGKKGRHESGIKTLPFEKVFECLPSKQGTGITKPNKMEKKLNTCKHVNIQIDNTTKVFDNNNTVNSCDIFNHSATTKSESAHLETVNNTSLYRSLPPNIIDIFNGNNNMSSNVNTVVKRRKSISIRELLN